jgi:transposase InsO family protein
MSMDITGPHPRSREGNEYIMTVVDSFSKFAEAFPIRVHTAQVVARRLVDGVFSRYGVPLRLLSDQGPEFESALIQELCKSYGIEKLRTSSYQPRTNGTCERFHRTLNSMLAKVVSESQRNWDRHVAPVMAAYRSTVHRSTGYSPNFIVYGRENRAPVDLVIAVKDEPPEIGSSPDSFVQELLDRQRRAYDLVRQHLGQAAERRKREYDFRVKHRDFHVNQWVWYLYPRRYKGRSPKWTRQYTGPFLVVREIPPCNFVIQRSQRSKAMVVHADKLKACLGDTPKSWLVDPGQKVNEPAPVVDYQTSDEVLDGVLPLVDSYGETDPSPLIENVDPGGESPAEVEMIPSQMESPVNKGRFRNRERLRRPARYDL